jgi:hypothetical protein
MSLQSWRVAAASAVGTSHLKTETPCQDSFLCLIANPAGNDEVLIAVVADGAGSAARSDAGSHLACIAFSDVVQLYFTLGGQVEGIARGTVEQWIALVREQLTGLAEKDGAPVSAYACTLLAAVVGPTTAAFLQIGDGAIVVDDNEMGWRCIFWPQKGEFANSTNFITQENAIARVEFVSLARNVLEVALFTDGIENLVLQLATRTAHRPYFDKVFGTLRTANSKGIDSVLSLGLANFLQSGPVCDRTDDDKTLVLASRRIPEETHEA